jgi:hypothetical protein
LLCILSLIFFYRYKIKNKSPDLLLFILVTGLMLLTHYSGIFVVITEGLLSLKSLKRFFFPFLAVGISFILFNSVFFQQLSNLSSFPERTGPFISYVFYMFYSQAENAVLFILLIPLSLWGAYRAWKKDQPFFLLWIVPILFLTIFSVFKTMIVYPRYAISSSIGFYILAGAGLDKIKKKNVQWMLVSLICIFSVFSVISYYRSDAKEDWRQLSSYLDANAGKSDMVIFYPGFTKYIVYDYYKKKELSTFQLTESSRSIDQADLERITPLLDHETIWLVLSQNLYSQGLIDMITKNHRDISEKNFTKITLYRFSKE